MKLEKKTRLKNKIRLWIRLILNWRFLICFGLAWIITNGWAYILLGLGLTLKFGWMVGISSAYLAFLWLPVTPEKILTMSIALFFVKILFPAHNEELRKQIEDDQESKETEFKDSIKDIKDNDEETHL